jgi:antitoxin (DNA-binding transcriptional repressor) of toxin-antitoxin stability system
MTITVPMTEAKMRFSELAAKVAYGGDSVVVTKHGKPLLRISRENGTPPTDERDPDDWVWKVAGALADDDEFAEIMEDVIASRRGRMPRPVPPIWEDDSGIPA